MRLYVSAFISNVGSNDPVDDAVTYVLMYSKNEPVCTGKEPTVYGKLNKLPDGVIPSSAEYRSSVEKLFWYIFTPKSLNTSATKSLDTP